jgi:superfamily I DNA/RNA helicase
VLRGNYRNTAEIMQYASRVVSGDFTDLDTTVEHHDTETPTRHGLQPVERSFSDLEAHDRSLLDAVRGALAWPGVSAGDLAVVAVNPRHVGPYVDLLRRHGIAAVDVAFHNGSATEQVRVATVKRIKGLEYKHVFCVRVDAASLRLAQAVGEAPDAHAERLELMRRELFVAMTRARDTLWVGSVGPSAVPLLAGPAQT